MFSATAFSLAQAAFSFAAYKNKMLHISLKHDDEKAVPLPYITINLNLALFLGALPLARVWRIEQVRRPTGWTINTCRWKVKPFASPLPIGWS